jgi:hypothetical protein
MFAIAPLQVNTYINLNDSDDPKNANIELSIDSSVISQLTQDALNLKANRSDVWTQSQSNILSASVSALAASVYDNYYVKGEIDQYIQGVYSNLQRNLEFPEVEDNNIWGVLSKPTDTEPSFVRRLSGVYPISTSLNSNNVLAWTDIQISLDMNLTGLNNYYTKTEVNNSLALKAPINNPTFTGTLYCPQLTSWPTPQLYDFNIVKASGLYHYDSYGSVTGLRNAPTNSANFRSIEIGNDNRCSQIAMPWDTDQMFFRRKQDSSFTPWREVVHSGNINTFIQPSLNTKQDKLIFPYENNFDGWRLVSSDNLVRRPIGDDEIQVAGVLDLANGGSSITDKY